ncbi:siderophore ABC transporter substrate-binding protein [Gorillibacterium timonense]|nr:siderophore ABC transporter substrate-binding protein [Gorillibacterium timonense]
MKKKYTAAPILLFFILALLVAGCGQSKSTSEGNAASASPSASTEPSAATTAPTSAAADSEELTITHKLGEIKLKKNPAKVVVFDFGTLDTLDKLGVEVTGLPKSNLPSYLDKYKDDKYESVGGLMEPDFEKINALKPDLIIISGRQQTSYEEFAKIAPTLFVSVDANAYMSSFKENVTLLGQIFGKESEAAAEVTKLTDAAAKLKEENVNSGKKGLIVLTTGGKVSAYGPGSRFGIIHDELGVAPVDTEIKADTHGQSISFEYVAEKNPDYLFVVDRDAVVASDGASPAKSVVENDLVKKTNAYKNGKIIYLDPNYWYLSGGGLLSVEEMIKEVSNGVK